MTGPWRLAIPKHVLAGDVGAILSPDRLKQELRVLLDDPFAGLPAPDGSRLWSIQVVRLPLRLTVIANYGVLEEQRMILVSRLSFASDADDEAASPP